MKQETGSIFATAKFRHCEPLANEVAKQSLIRDCFVQLFGRPRNDAPLPKRWLIMLFIAMAISYFGNPACCADDTQQDASVLAAAEPKKPGIIDLDSKTYKTIPADSLQQQTQVAAIMPLKTEPIKHLPLKTDESELVTARTNAKISARLEAFVDKSAITIGEKVKYSIAVETDKNVKVEFPAFGDNLGGFVVKDFHISDPKKSGEGRLKREQWYLLDTYTTGSYVIPAQTISVTLPSGETKALTSQEIFVEVKTVMDKTKDEGIRDIKGPLSVVTKLPVLIAALSAVLILLIGGVIGWLIYLKKFRKDSALPAIPPDEVALRELRRIEEMDLIHHGRVKEYYYLVSNCLRTYLENRFSLRAPEQTTEEFLEAVSNGDALDGKFINLLKEYLRHCDLVKYAKLEPEETECVALITTTRTFIEETKPVAEQISEETDEDES